MQSLSLEVPEQDQSIHPVFALGNNSLGVTVLISCRKLTDLEDECEIDQLQPRAKRKK